MKKLFLLALFIPTLSFGQLDGLLKKASDKVKSKTSSTSTSKSGNVLTSNLDIASGLKEALQVGINKGTQQLSAVDGFFGNAALKILMPPEAVKAMQRRRWGWNDLFNYVLTLPGDAQLDVCMALLPFLLSEEPG